MNPNNDQKHNKFTPKAPQVILIPPALRLCGVGGDEISLFRFLFLGGGMIFSSD